MNTPGYSWGFEAKKAGTCWWSGVGRRFWRSRWHGTPRREKYSGFPWEYPQSSWPIEVSSLCVVSEKEPPTPWNDLQGFSRYWSTPMLMACRAY